MSVSKRLDPDQVRHCVWSGLDPNCFQRQSMDDTRQIKKKEREHLDNCEVPVSFQ